MKKTVTEILGTKKKKSRKALMKKANWGLIIKIRPSGDTILLILVGKILALPIWRDANGRAAQSKYQKEETASLHLDCVTAMRAQRVNSYFWFACVTYTDYFLEIVSKVCLEYFLFTMKYEKYMMQANSKSSCFTSALSEGSVILEKGGQR